MSVHVKEWRAVGIDIEEGKESLEVGHWHGAKAAARADVTEMRSATVPYDRIIVQRRKVSAPKRVGLA